MLDALEATKRYREHDRHLQLRPRRHARARTAACTRSGTTPTRRPPTSRSSSSGPPIKGGAARARHPDEPRRPAADDARPGGDRPRRGPQATLAADHTEARPLVGRDLSGAILDTEATAPSEPVLFVTDDEISEGNEKPGSPFQRYRPEGQGVRDGRPAQPHRDRRRGRRRRRRSRTVVKFSRYHDNQQFWTVPGERDERLSPRKIDQGDRSRARRVRALRSHRRSIRERQSRVPAHADARSHELQERMLKLLVDQLDTKRLVPSAGEVPGYRPPLVG